MQTITFIGNGNMGLSIAQGLKGKYHIEVVGRDMNKLDAFEKALDVHVDKYLLDDFDMTDKTVLLCVKPNNVEEVGKKLSGKARVLFSVLAGTTVEKLKQHIKSKAVVRAMPNLAASVGASMTTLTGDHRYQKEASELLRIRKKLKLTQQEAAMLTGGGRNAFSRYERGKAKPLQSVTNLFKLLDNHPDLLDEITPGSGRA